MIPLRSLAALCLALFALPAAASDTKALEQHIADIASRAGGDVGVGVRHLESGETVLLRGHERFPMFSVYKLPISMALLSRVDKGDQLLDIKVKLGYESLRPSVSAAINGPAGKGQWMFTVRELLDATLVASDNTASDVVLGLAGGPAAVTAYLRNLGITDLRVDREEIEMAADLAGATLPPDRDGWTLDRLNAALRVPDAQRRAATRRYLHEDARDTATPEAALALLARVHRRNALGAGTSALLVRTMESATTGLKRIRGLLPEGTVVADKTGSGPRTTNDVGIVTLPGDAGHLAIAVFVRDSPRPDTERERTIAEIARAAYDHYVR